MNIQRKNSAHHFRMQSEREQTFSGMYSNVASASVHSEKTRLKSSYYYNWRASEASETLSGLFNRESRIYILYVYVIARAGVIFGIYFTSCRYSGG